VARAIEENRTPCKCPTPVSEDIIRTLYEGEFKVTNELKPDDHLQDISDDFIDLMVSSSPSEESLQRLVEEAVDA
jgi:hypothetical protein